MTDAFLDRMPGRTDAELWAYVRNPSGYRTEAVEAAVAELARRGQPLAPEALAALRDRLHLRDRNRPRLAPFGPVDPARLRIWIRAILLVGLGAALLIYLRARPAPANPLGYDPMDTKRYLRELETLGGKANVLATQFQQWIASLGQGRSLAVVVALATVLLAWLVSLLGARPQDSGGTDGKPR